MTIIEQSITGKKSQRECEDGIEANERFIAVIDGSTSKSRNRIMQSMSNGRFCMDMVKQYIATMPEDTSLEDFCEGVTGHIRSKYNELGIDLKCMEANPNERPTASAIIYSAHYRQIWMVGDCQCLIDGVYYENPKPQEKIIAEKRSRFLKRCIDEGCAIKEIQSNDIGRTHILNDLIESCKGQNITYPVIDGFNIPIKLVKVINLANGTKEIVLASDGYPFLKKSLKESEQALSRLLENDPLCINLYKATKGLMEGNRSFDDRSYIRFEP